MELHTWLADTTAADIMVRDVLILWENEILAEAAGLLLKKQMSGAPVVDEGGKCVGVLSIMDLPRAEEKVAEERKAVAESSLFQSSLVLPASIYAEKLAEVRDKIAPAAEQPVKNFMTRDVVSVGEDMPLSDIVQRMIDAHIHRVVVLNIDRRVKGLVSTTDILAALIRAGREASSMKPFSGTRDF